MSKVKDGWLIINEDINDLSSIDFNGQTKIHFSHIFNSSINSLPDNITHITFSVWSSYNKPINNLPNSLKYIYFGTMYDQPIDYLPNNIKIIRLSNLTFVRVIDKLPLTIKYIIFDANLIYNRCSVICLNKFVKKIKIYANLSYISYQEYYYLRCYKLINYFCHHSLCDNRCEINKHNHTICNTKLIDLLLK